MDSNNSIPATYLSSVKGNRMLIYNNFLYYKDKLVNNKMFFKCSEYSKLSCPARCQVVEDHIIKYTGEHNHLPNTSKINARKALQALKDRAITTSVSTQQIIGEIASVVNESTASQLPSIPCLTRTVQRCRQTNNALGPIPMQAIDIVIPEFLKVTLSNHQFLNHDNIFLGRRILIFATEQNIRLLMRSPHWFCDGTFKVCPPQFSQFYTIHGVFNQSILPLIYAFLPGKMQCDYRRLFHYISGLHTFNPETIMVDFEAAAINSLHEYFPNTRIRGCFYHFSQCLWRKIQSCAEVLSRYINDEIFALNIRKLLSIAFVPPNDVIASFEQLTNFNFFNLNSELLQPLMDYIEDNFIGRYLRPPQRRTPPFPHTLWNQYEAVQTHIARTNNNVEGWHNGFSRLVQSHHPDIYSFIKKLQLEQAKNELKITQLISGMQNNSQRRIYRDVDERLERVVSSYGSVSLEDYLTGLSHNLNYYI